MKHSEPLKLDIELYFAEELSKEDASSLECHLQQCPVCHDYLQTLRRERNEFLADHPFSELKIEKSQSPWFQKLLDILTRPALYPVYGLLLIVAITVPVLFFGNRAQISDEIRYKGTAGLTFFFQRDGVIHEGDKRKQYRGGDQIQILYNSTKEQFAALISIDSRGQISFYHPQQNSDFCSEKTTAGAGLTFPGSIILDDSEGSELIILLLSDKPLPVKTVRTWISELYEEFPQISELEKVIVKKKLKPVSQAFTLLLHKE